VPAYAYKADVPGPAIDNLLSAVKRSPLLECSPVADAYFCSKIRFPLMQGEKTNVLVSEGYALYVGVRL
jgi:hypothetical protein